MFVVMKRSRSGMVAMIKRSRSDRPSVARRFSAGFSFRQTNASRSRRGERQPSLRDVRYACRVDPGLKPGATVIARYASPRVHVLLSLAALLFFTLTATAFAQR